MKSGNLNFLEPSGSLQACKGTALPYLHIHKVKIDQFGIKIMIAAENWM
jgi:hypothetical protein